MSSHYYAQYQRAVLDDYQRRYVTRRLQVELRELNHCVGRQALRTALRCHGRKALRLKAFTPRTTDLPSASAVLPTCCLTSRARPRPTVRGSVTPRVY